MTQETDWEVHIIAMHLHTIHCHQIVQSHKQYS